MRYQLCLILLIASFCLCKSVYGVVEMRSGQNAATASKELTFDQIKVAAEGGDKDAQYALGYLYFYGKNGAPKDSALAKTWIGKAASQQQPQAVKALALINGRYQDSGKDTQKAALTFKPNNDREQGKQPNVASRNLATTHEENMTLVDMRKENKVTSATSELNSNSGLYTLQLLGAFNKDSITKLVNKHHLGAKAKIYQTTLQGKNWYVLTYGQFKTKLDAREAAAKFEHELALKPWVKPYSSVKQHKLVSAS